MPNPLARRIFIPVIAAGGPTDQPGSPTVAITSSESSPTSANPIPITITFSEYVTGFTVDDVTVGGGTASGFSQSGRTYSLNVTPTGNAPVTVGVAAAVCKDLADNDNEAATQFAIGIQVSLTYQPADATGQDTFLDVAAADTVRGSLDYVGVRLNKRHALIKFPISLGASPSVISGVLSGYAQVQVAGTHTFTARRILDAVAAWGEGSTWNYKTPTTARWSGDAGGDGGADAGCSQAGTDISSTVMATATYTGNAAAGTEVQFALDPTELGLMCTSNNGIWLTTNLDANFSFCSCENATAGYRPKLVLVVQYLP